ncbi:LysM peptidoglycan-binding domain-containing M23 family metallopeptidase, partial [Streptomyces sp. NPDC029216]|uniref:LysM peptidoglycan-binding domain-containing M23 family metallopeptidase n=1 Tax=Streptomyces sp. NPDC029216 TaxID=3154701 RepID=UPI00340CBE25
QAPAALRAAAPAAAPAVYTVVTGDCLSTIAAEHQLSGGWQQLYADNREAVGADPSLIHPGLRLTLGGQGAAPAPKAPEAPAEESSTGSPAAGQDTSGEAPSDDTATDPGASAASGGTQLKGSAAPSRGLKQSAPAAQSAPASAAGFVAPVSGGVSTAYRTPGAMWSSGYHTGVDFIASTGTTVRAVGAGTVVSAGWGGAYGNEVVIRHADGKYSQYGHLSQLNVSTGQTVTAGQAIGLSGATGNVTGPHLHFEIRTGPSYGSDIDPLAYLRSKGVTL